MRKQKIPRPLADWQSALVHADWWIDAGDEAMADHWRLVGQTQFNALLLWTKYGDAWSATDLRKLHMNRRVKNRKYEVNGETYILEMWFAVRGVHASLYRRTDGTGTRWSDGHTYTTVGSGTFKRTSMEKHGPDKLFRDLILRILA